MTNNYINLQDDEVQNNNIFAKEQNRASESEMTPAPSHHEHETPAHHENQNEMSDIEMEMFTVAESAFNRKRAQAHEEIDKLYDEMIRSAKDKVKGITASIVAEVSGQ